MGGGRGKEGMIYLPSTVMRVLILKHCKNIAAYEVAKWGSGISVAAPKDSSIFQGKFRENFGCKNCIFPKFCHNIQNFVKNYHFKILTKLKISERKILVEKICNFSTNFFWRERSKILQKVSPKL